MARIPESESFWVLLVCLRRLYKIKLWAHWPQMPSVPAYPAEQHTVANLAVSWSLQRPEGGHHRTPASEPHSPFTHLRRGMSRTQQLASLSDPALWVPALRHKANSEFLCPVRASFPVWKKNVRGRIHFFKVRELGPNQCILLSNRLVKAIFFFSVDSQVVSSSTISVHNTAFAKITGIV